MKFMENKKRKKTKTKKYNHKVVKIKNRFRI